MLRRDLADTCTPPGKNLALLIAQCKALGMAVRNSDLGEPIFMVVGKVDYVWLMPSRDHISSPANIFCQFHLHLDGSFERHRIQVLEQFWHEIEAVTFDHATRVSARKVMSGFASDFHLSMRGKYS